MESNHTTYRPFSLSENGNRKYANVSKFTVQYFVKRVVDNYFLLNSVCVFLYQVFLNEKGVYFSGRISVILNSSEYFPMFISFLMYLTSQHVFLLMQFPVSKKN